MSLPPKADPSQEAIDTAARLAGWVPPDDRDRPIEADDPPPPSRTRLTPVVTRRRPMPLVPRPPESTPIPVDHATPVLHERRFTMIPTASSTDTTPKRPRGFAAMDPERVKAIAAKGAKAAHAAGTAHRFTVEEAKAAGRKGGIARHRSRGPSSKPPPPDPAAEE